MFWGVQEIMLVVELYLDEELIVKKGLSSHLERLTKSLAEQMPSKVLLSSLLQCWPSIESLKHHVGLHIFHWCGLVNVFCRVGFLALAGSLSYSNAVSILPLGLTSSRIFVVFSVTSFRH